jgi:hypothetical protein
MLKEAFFYTNNFLNEKYEQYCLDILSIQINESRNENKFNNIKFCTLLDEFLFVILYEPEQYFEVIDKVKKLTYMKLLNLTKKEIDFLFIKCLGEIKEFHYDKNKKFNMSTELKINYVANELIGNIKQAIAKRLIDESEKIVSLFLKVQKDEISEILYTGPFVGNDIYYENYWYAFCRKVQYGEENELDFFLKGIQDHLYRTLNKISTKEIILLFTQTDYFIFEDDNLFPTPARGEMIHCLVPKLLKDIRDLAAQEDLSIIHDLNMFS